MHTMRYEETNKLEPFISAQIMEIHHAKHHQAYVTNLNIAEEKIHEAVNKNDISAQLDLQSAFKFNGGGHVNHSIFWTNLAPPREGGGQLSQGVLFDAIKKDFGSLEAFKTKFATRAAGVQGSGWAWLGYNNAEKRLEISTTANQDPLSGAVPLLGVDVW
jgi:Fe-Mn family superoxide dismutase